MRRLVPALALVASLAIGDLFGQERPRHGRLFPPQDLGLLEGPDRDLWQKPDQVMDALGIADGSVVADLGAGAGWFTIRLARRVGPNGLVFAEDVQTQMIEAIKRRVQREGLQNVRTRLGRADDPDLPVGSLDAAMMVGVYGEIEEPIALLRNVGRALKPQGRFGVIDFKREGTGPGPAMDERVDPELVIKHASEAGLKLLKRGRFLPYQFLLVFGKSEALTTEEKGSIGRSASTPPAGARPRAAPLPRPRRGRA
ncbi:MAG: class I SAM-dependent methyltransferase [Acidobacteria bacterium]|nr:class I SAM-dependent methyltransferase [Acidobacteriota bacterium]MBI3265289.1 class I SAM-dependent methyltransferase [Acidobacteriota bacterium]